MDLNVISKAEQAIEYIFYSLKISTKNIVDWDYDTYVRMRELVKTAPTFKVACRIYTEALRNDGHSGFVIDCISIFYNSNLIIKYPYIMLALLEDLIKSNKTDLLPINYIRTKVKDNLSLLNSTPALWGEYLMNLLAEIETI